MSSSNDNLQVILIVRLPDGAISNVPSHTIARHSSSFLVHAVTENPTRKKQENPQVNLSKLRGILKFWLFDFPPAPLETHSPMKFSSSTNIFTAKLLVASPLFPRSFLVNIHSTKVLSLTLHRFL